MFHELNREEIVKQSKRVSNDVIDITKKLVYGEKQAISESDRTTLSATLYEAFMKSLGIDTVNDPNTIETAFRVSKMFHFETCSSLWRKPPEITVFPNTEKYDQYVVVNNMDYFSLCSHHHVPFYGNVYCAYHPKDKLCGISKLHRVVKYFASKPQLQERMTQEIIDFLHSKLDPIGIMVVVTGTHLCMCARGTKAQKSSLTVTSAVKGEEAGFDKNEAMKLFEIKTH